MMNTYLTEGKRFFKTWLCDSSGGYKKGVFLGVLRVYFLLASLFLISTSSIFSSKTLWQESLSDPWISNVWYEGMAHNVLIVCWLYYKENHMKTRCFVWIAALLILGAGVTYAYVSKELATLTPEEEFVTMYVFDSHSHVLKTQLIVSNTDSLEERMLLDAMILYSNSTRSIR